MATKDTKISLFSRARPGKKAPPKRIRGFLALPGELRNRIYQFYFEKEFHCELLAEESHIRWQKGTTVKLWPGGLKSGCLKCQPKQAEDHPEVIRLSRPLGKYKLVDGIRTEWSTSLCPLILVCKQIHSETIALLYRNTTIVSNSPKRISNFLSEVSPTNLALISKLELHYTSYGHPSRPADNLWGKKHHASWMRTCGMLVDKLVGLRELTIWVEGCAGTAFSGLNQQSIEPLFQFRRLASGRVTGSTVESDSVQLHKSIPASASSLTSVTVHHRGCSGVRKYLDRERPPVYHPWVDLCDLFGQAIGRAILGASESEAMKAVLDAKNGKYKMFSRLFR